MPFRTSTLAALSFAAVSLHSVMSFAQQAIVSLPSADITPKHELFVMQESQIRPFGNKPYWNTTNFYCFGLGYHTELAITTFNLGVPGTGNVSVGQGFKTSLPILTGLLPTSEVTVTFGAMALFSISRFEVGHWVYAHLSGRLPVTRTRLTVGYSHGSRHLFERHNVSSFMAAIEQPLGTDKLNLVAEWFSGEHDLGNFIWGLVFHPNHHWIFVLGHKVPTSGPVFGKDKMAMVTEVGLFF